MSWEGSHRRDQLPDNWDQLRAQVRDRADRQCEQTHPYTGRRCQRQGTDCHHLGPPDDHRLDNLQWLCGPCHATITGKQGAAARATKYRRNRPARPHPGTIGGVGGTP